MLHRGYIQSWNLIVERKLPAKMVASIGYVGSASVNGLRVPRHQRVADSRARATKGGRSSRSSGGRRRPESGTAARTASTTRCRPRINRRFSGRPAAQGCLHLLEGHRRGQLLRLDGVQLERGERVRSQPRAGGSRHPAQLPARRSCTSCRSAAGKKWAHERRQQRDPRRLAVERRLRRLLGTAVHADRLRLVAEHAGQPADAGPGQGQRRDPRQRRRRRHVLRHDRVRARHRRSGSATWAATPCAGPAWSNLDLGLFRTFKVTQQSNLQFRAEAFNVTNTPHFGNPNGNVNSSNFGRVLSHADRGCDGAVAGVPLRPAYDVLDRLMV